MTGDVVIAGDVGGNASAAGGNVELTETGTIGGTFEAGAETVRIAGTVAGNARVGATTIGVGPAASIGGDLECDGTLDVADGAQIQGETIRNPDLEVGGGPGAGSLVPGWILGVYAVVVNLLVGALLLLAFPGFSRGLVDRTTASPGRTGFLGLGVLVGVPILLVLVALTIVGIPLSIAGFVLWVLLAWIGSIYGRYVLGAWLLSLVDRDNRWVALVLGVVLIAVLVRIPVVGGIVDFGVLVWGLGALAWGLWAAYRSRRGSGGDTATASGAGDASGSEAV